MSDPSYNIFNYNYRPAKSIERKIIVELLKEIYGVINSQHCTYIGLGSIFFSDFRLIHRELGIQEMINIEENESDEKRFKFNKPFTNIKLKWGLTTDVLPSLDWKGKKIIWLDYDYSLQPYMFEDLEIIFSNIESGGFYLFSCNSALSKYFDQKEQEYKVEKFVESFQDNTPFDLKPSDLSRKNSPKLIRSMIVEKIKEILTDRNASKDEDEKLSFYQLLNISYQDGAPMFSIGGFISNKKDINLLEYGSLKELPYIKLDKEILNIEYPVITAKETDLLNSFLPREKKKFLKLKTIDFIPEDDRSQFQRIYRYYPSFVEIRDN